MPGVFTDARGGRFDYYDYLYQAARAAQVAGFNGVYVPWDEQGEDSWIVTTALARRIEQLVFLPEVQPGFATPVYFAKLAASFQRFAGLRLAYKLDLELDPVLRRAHGEVLEGADFLAKAAEFVTATNGVTTERPYDFEGRFFGVEKGGLSGPLGVWPRLPLYTSGHTVELVEFGATHADVHWFELTADLPQLLERLTTSARAQRRQVRAGVRATVVSRATELAAKADAEGRNLAAGHLIGSYESVARRIEELTELGVSQFVFDGVPRLEEAYRLGEHVFPRLSAKTRPRRRAA